jgi:hypothetical protein
MGSAPSALASMGTPAVNMVGYGVRQEQECLALDATLYVDEMRDGILLGVFCGPDNVRLAFDENGRLKDGRVWQTCFSRPLHTGDYVRITGVGQELTFSLNKEEEITTHVIAAFGPPYTPFIVLRGTRATTRGIQWN